MKTRNLALRVTMNSALMIIAVYLFMQSIGYFRDNIIFGISTVSAYPATVGAFMGLYVLPPTFAFSVILYGLAYRLQKVQLRLEAGEEISRELAEKTRLRILGFSRVVLALNLIGFAAGFVVLLAFNGRLGDILRIENVIIMISNLMAGFVFASAQTALNNNAFARLRELLGFRDIRNRKRERRSTLRQFALSCALGVYAVAYTQSNVRDAIMAQDVDHEVRDWVRTGKIGQEEAGPAYRKLLGERLRFFSTRSGKLEEIVPLPWERNVLDSVVQQRVFLLLALFALSVVAGVQLIVSLQARGQLDRLKERLKEAVAGGRDLTQRLNLTSMDDIGELTELINVVLDQFQAVVSRISVSAMDTRKNAAGIDEVLTESEEISRRTSKSVLALGEDIEKQAADARKLEQLIGSFRAAVSGVETAAETQNQFAAETSTAMEEMASNIKSVETMTARSGQLTERLSAQGESGGQAVKETSVAIGEISDSAAKVREVLTVLKKIAADINLLAMNAAIEAAHAGDKGMGFAVVADEVRRLASTAGDQTKSIGAMLKTMMDKVRQGVSRSEASGKALDDLIAGILQSASISREISDAMKEQSAGTSSVAKNLEKVLEASRAIRERTAEQAEQTALMARNLGESVRNFEALARSSRDQSQDIDALEESFARVRKEVNSNLETVKALTAEVEGFKI